MSKSKQRFEYDILILAPSVLQSDADKTRRIINETFAKYGWRVVTALHEGRWIVFERKFTSKPSDFKSEHP